MTKIRELICKRYYLAAGSGEELYSIQIIVRYNSERVTSQTYFKWSDIPYSIRDYMTTENQKEVKWIDQRDSIFRVLSSTYREDDL